MRKRAWNFIDLTGQSFERLTVIKLIEKENGIHWFCECECGGNTTTTGNKLKSGHTKSCGCIKSELTIKRNTTHGLYYHPLRGVHNTMKQRCTNPEVGMYYRYGARGISVCKEWDNFIDFYTWANNNGYKKGLTIDRIENDGNYEPSNCQWITIEDNIRKNAKLSPDDKLSIVILYLDSRIKVRDIALQFNIDESRIYQILQENKIKYRRKNV